MSSVEESAGYQMAKWVVDRGGLVIPAYIDRLCEKRPLLREWQNSGSRDYGQLEQWWTERPWANAGVIGGRGSLAVFDCDGSEAVSGFRTLCERVGGIDWSQVLCYRTPGRKDADGTGGGLHAMWRWPDWLASFHKAEIREEGWRGGIELRGNATWTLLPCARRDGEYEMISAPDKIAELPRELWLAFAEVAQQTVTGNGDGDLRELSPEAAWNQAPWTDGRKNAVAAIAWYVMLRDMDEDEALELCMSFSEQCCNPPLDEALVRRKVEYTAQRIEKIRMRQQAEMMKWNTSINKLFS